MIDQIFTTALQKYGIFAAVALYIAKTLFDLFSGNLLRYIKAIDANTAALEKLTKDLQIAFFNLKEIRDKNQMGPISKPGELEL
jgi:hypothetical protein